MKKYKLIKEYPGSPKINSIYIKDSIYGYSHYRQEGFNTPRINNTIIECNPKFWKEIIERNYRIISFDYINTSKIKSIKRLPDNEIFTIGDQVNISNEDFRYNFIIEKFKLSDDLGCTVHFNPHRNAPKRDWASLSTISHIKTPFFTTEDGINIYENDIFFVLVNPFNNIKKINICKQYATEFYRNYKFKEFQLTFSTEEKAKEYIINKKQISIQDLIDIKGDYTHISGKRLIQEVIKKFS